MRHAAHVALMEGSFAMNDWHGAEPKPVLHAACASARSLVMHAPGDVASTGVETLVAQPP